MTLRSLVQLGGFLLGMAVLANAPSALAVGPMTLEPSIVRLTMRPGEIWRGQVSVTNDSDATMMLVPTTANLSRSGEDDTINVTEDITKRLGTLAAWVQLGSDVFAVGPGERETFNFSIQVPENAPPGTHRGLLILAQSHTQPRANALSATAAVALGIDLTVVGQPNHHIRLADMFVSPRFGTKPPVTVMGTITNTGNTLPVMSLYADINRVFGSSVRVPMNPENGSEKVVPGTQTLFRGVWGGEGFFGAGLFKIRITAEDSSGLYHDSRYVVLIPWQMLLGALIAAIIVVFGRKSGPQLFVRHRKR